MHYISCSNCNRYLQGIKNILHQACNFRRTISQNYSSSKEMKIKDMQEMARAANTNLLFHTIGCSPNAEYLIEFPLLCVVRTESGSCPLVYAQIPPCCWAVPLDPSSPARPEVANNFSAVVHRINKVLLVKREEYLRLIPEEGKTAKLIIGYLPKCCIETQLHSCSWLKFCNTSPTLKCWTQAVSICLYVCMYSYIIPYNLGQAWPSPTLASWTVE